MTPLFIILLFLALTSAQDTDDVAEEIAKANEGTIGLVDGDVIPNTLRNADRCTARGCKWPKSGRYVRVPIYIARSFSRSERTAIIRTLLKFHSSTCIRFQWRRRQREYLYFYPGTGCWSYIGRQRGRGQAISLQKGGCFSTRTIQHEVLHALGFHHEQKRSDRDRYVSILTNNIQPGRLRAFQKTRTNNLGVPYDLNSIMHYGNYAFSRNGQKTIIAKGNPGLSLGTATSMTSNDIALVNRLYRCTTPSIPVGRLRPKPRSNEQEP